VNGTLAVADTAADSPQIVSLSGTGVGGRCGHQGEQCWPGHPCCSGLTCRKLGLRAFCEP
jgi:hypothetical protein